MILANFSTYVCFNLGYADAGYVCRFEKEIGESGHKIQKIIK